MIACDVSPVAMFFNYWQNMNHFILPNEPDFLRFLLVVWDWNPQLRWWTQLYNCLFLAFVAARWMIWTTRLHLGPPNRSATQIIRGCASLIVVQCRKCLCSMNRDLCDTGLCTHCWKDYQLLSCTFCTWNPEKVFDKTVFGIAPFKIQTRNDSGHCC